MDLYNKPIDEITYADIEQFLDGEFPESETLDYKWDWPGSSPAAPGQKRDSLASTMCAFANTSGGLILVGVEEDRRTGKPVLPPSGVSISNEGDTRLRIQNEAIDGVYPSLVPEVAVCPLRHDVSKAVVVVRVSESAQAPHATNQRQRVYVRVKAQNRFDDNLASLERLEVLWNRRAAAVERRERMILAARDRAGALREVYQPNLQGRFKGPQVEAFACPLFPDATRTLMEDLARFVEDCGNVTHSRITDAPDYLRQFPADFSPIRRSVADGVAIASRSPSGVPHQLQINAWGLVHSTIALPCDSIGAVEAFFATWVGAHLEAFIEYLCLFYSRFPEFAIKPSRVWAAIRVATGQYLALSKPLPFVDTAFALLDEVLLPRDLADQKGLMLLRSISSLCWAAGVPWQPDSEHLRKLLFA